MERLKARKTKNVDDLVQKKAPPSSEKNAADGSYHEFQDTNRWHQKRIYCNRKITVCGMITGCGIAQMYGVSDASEEELLKELPKIKSDFKADGAGAIIATLGKTYYNHEEKLLNVGFELMKEYPNYRHGLNGSYTQRCYILTY